ncbi:MAG: DUF342 domain-containing protein [Clostridia bacterium]|nr:DUF342 domain-containing protein [Clostridia bacterium]
MIKELDCCRLELEIADDYYSAYLNVTFHDMAETADVTDAPKVTLYEEVIEVLKENHVTYGIKEDVVQGICDARKNVNHVLIAEGEPHQNGANAEIKYAIDFDNKPKPKLNDDGSVDFKDMSFIETVKPGEVLAEKTPATQGVDGMTVGGKVIKARNGKDKVLKRGENTVLLEDEMILASEVEGIARLINGRVSVLRFIEVRVVGPETGNLYFSGDIHVKEHILDGYTVTCDGNLVVDGVVEAAKLKVKGDLIVGKGILGRERADIVVNGDMVSKFIENANVYVKGDISTGEIINSTVLCDSQIIVKGKKGLIIGGEITSKYVIDAKRIGSKLGVITTINLGVDSGAIKELKHLKEMIQELRIVEEKLDIMIPVIETQLKEHPDDEKLHAKLEQYKNSLHSTRMDLEEKNKRLDKLTDALKKVKKGQVRTNIVYPDTVVKIGNASYFIDQALKDCIITREDDKVIAIGF